MDTFNGFKNRSTWLARLHLENTSPEVLKEAQALAQRWKEKEDYWNELKKRDPMSYSYPFHQNRAIQVGGAELLKSTAFSQEKDCSEKQVVWDEVYESIYQPN